MSVFLYARNPENPEVFPSLINNSLPPFEVRYSPLINRTQANTDFSSFGGIQGMLSAKIMVTCKTVVNSMLSISGNFAHQATSVSKKGPHHSTHTHTLSHGSEVRLHGGLGMCSTCLPIC